MRWTCGNSRVSRIAIFQCEVPGVVRPMDADDDRSVSTVPLKRGRT